VDSPFSTKPPWLRDEDLARRCPFPESPPVIDRAALLDDPILWSTLLKRLGGSERQDAEIISDLANRLGIDRNRILAKLAAHYHDNRTLQ
jgi:hypothetical protein